MGRPTYRDHTLLPQAVRTPAHTAAAHVASTGGTLARTIVGLAIVLAVIFAVYWLLKTYARGKQGKSDGRMEVLATTALAPNRALHLVRVGDGLVLVGSSEQSVSRIRAYDAEESARIRAQLEGGDELRPAGGSWVDELRRRTAR